MPLLSDDSPHGPDSWYVTAVLAVMGGVGALWAIVRKDKGSAITQMNRVIRGHEKYAQTLESRVEDYQKKLAVAENEARELKSELTAALLEADRLAKHNADLQMQLDKRGG